MVKNKRIARPKKMRFEVFKRDSFRCQYCGRSAPDVILEVDHIKPVAAGGKNTMMNLVTSCRDCNRGKGKRELGDKNEVIKQKAVLDDLNERRQQMELMILWKTELDEIAEKQVSVIEKVLVDDSVYILYDHGRRKIKMLIKEFGFDTVYDAAEIASRQYPYITEMLNKIGGICYNISRKGQSNGSKKNS